MIRTILHQIWNERRQNGWLFIELVAVSVFLWLAIDPMFILESRRRIPDGYIPDNLYKVQLSLYNMKNPRFRHDVVINDSIGEAFYRNVFQTVCKIPEVQYATACDRYSYPNNGAYSSTAYGIDSAQTVDGKYRVVTTGIYSIMPAGWGDYLATLGVTDALTGEPAHIVHNGQVNNIYVSRSFAMEAFGRLDVVGCRISKGGKEFYICGVYDDIKHQQYNIPAPTVIEVCKPNFEGIFLAILIRLKDGVDGNGFMRCFNEEYAPHFTGGNYYCKGLISHRIERKEFRERKGYTNTYRLQSTFTLFALTCAFLGVVSTFWIRANVRRRDIGVMRSMGASARRIVMQFVIEATMLVTSAFLVALPLLAHKVYVMGFAEPISRAVNEPDGSYIADITWMHFTAVSIITYIILLSITLIGAIIPAHRIARILPSDALREE